MTLALVHFVDPDTWRVLRGYLNPACVAVVRPVVLRLADALCADCLSALGEVGRSPRCVSVRLLDGSSHVVLGDGVHGDREAVERARALLAARVTCERAQHLGFNAPGGAV